MGRYAIAVVVSVEQMACAVQNDQSLGGGADQKAPIAQMQQRAQIALKQQWNGRFVPKGQPLLAIAVQMACGGCDLPIAIPGDSGP